MGISIEPEAPRINEQPEKEPKLKQLTLDDMLPKKKNGVCEMS